MGKPETVVGGLDDLESLRALTRTRGRAGKLLGVQAGEVRPHLAKRPGCHRRAPFEKRTIGKANAQREQGRYSKTGSTSERSVPRAASYSGSTERTTSQNASLWFISRRCASSCVTT